MLPNTGLVRVYTFGHTVGESLFLGTMSGEICIFNLDTKIYKATMPIGSNGLLTMKMLGNLIFVGVGDGKLKRLVISDEGSWNLTHEAQLDSKVVSTSLSPDGNELLVGTREGKIYRVLTADLSFLLHTDAHSGAINDLHFDKERSDMFLVIDDNGFLKLWDLNTYKSMLTCSSGR